MSDQWMGSIAAQDQYRQLGNDPWTNTMRGTAPAPGQGFAPVQQSPVLYNTKAGPITEADIGGAIDIGMGVSGGGLKTDIVKAPGIKAYHSSPHDFDKFDLAKIGTGEGAQVYGHGLYFAENPAVSGRGGQYWEQFLDRFKGDELAASYALKQSKFDREAAIRSARDDLDYMQKRYDALPSGLKDNPKLRGAPTQEALAGRQRELALLESGKPIGPRTYEVNIKADPAHMLDWDKPLRSQSPEVVEGLQKAMRPSQWKEFNPADAGVAMNQGFIGLDKRIASEKLAEAGIPGIKYLDQGSRNAPISSMGIKQLEGRLKQYKDDLAGGFGDPERMRYNIASIERELASYKPTSNYVIFDPGIVDIMKKYGIAGAAPTGMGALAAQDAYRGDR